MTKPDNIVFLAEWKATHQRNQPQAQTVPVYVPVRDLDGRWQLELVGHTELDLDLIRIDPS